MRRVKPYLLLAAVFWLAPLAAYAVAPWFLPNENSDGQCSGLGYGCALPPADSVRFVVWLFSPLFFFTGLLAMLVFTLLRWPAGPQDRPVSDADMDISSAS